MTRHYLDRLAEVIRTNWNQPALTDYATLDGGEGNSYTYGEMYGQIRALCDRFHQLGIQKGDHIAICGANSANWAVAYLAIAAYSGVSVTILHSQTPEGIMHQLYLSDATALFVDIEIWAELDSSRLINNGLKDVLLLTDFSLLNSTTIPSITKPCVYLNDVSFALQPLDTLAQICFTSGSTESQKGVMLSARNISASAFCVTTAYTCHENKELLCAFPLAHMFGVIGEVLVPLYQACHITFFPSLSLTKSYVDALIRIRPYQILSVPMIVSALLKLRNGEVLQQLSKFVEYFSVGGAVFPVEMQQQILHYAIPLNVGYGMTETASLISVIAPTYYRVGTTGKICSSLEGRIADNGEILVRGENVMLGYYKDPEATAAKIDKGGWLHTGDRGHLDEEGNLYVEGRLNQDMVVLPSGENISLPNVESIINQVDGVEESLVLARNGHLVALVYTSANLNRQNLLRTINPQLPSFSQLYDLEFVSVPFQRTEKRTIKRYLYQ